MRSIAMTALAILTLAVAVPLTASASHPAPQQKCKTTKTGKKHTLRSASSNPAAVFGAQGGNMVPWSISIGGDGSISANGWLKAKNSRLTDPRNELNALFTLSDAEGFWSMPAMTNCQGTLPDVASQYIELTSATGTKRVTVHGGCVARFNELMASLQNAVGATR